jgi:hypothetical protein
MPSRSHEARPYLSRQRSNSVPTFGLVNVSAEEAGILFSAAERATARRKRPVSVDSPGPVMEKTYDVEQIPARTFNFSTPSRLGFGSSPLKHILRSDSIHTVASERTLPSPQSEEDLGDVEATPLAATFPSSSNLPRSPLTETSPLSPRRVVDNSVLKAYADGLFTFTQCRLNDAAPTTLRTLGLKREPSLPSTPVIDVDELPRPPRPAFTSQFSDWSSTRASSIFGASSPPSPLEPRTPEDQSGLMTPDSFFAEITPRVAQTAQWAAAMNSARASSNLGGSFFLDSPTISSLQLQRTSSATSSEAFSYFAGFDGATEAAGTRLSNDLSPLARQARLQNSGFIPRSQPGSSASNHVPYMHHQASSPYNDMMSLSRTPSWQVRAVS